MTLSSCSADRRRFLRAEDGAILVEFALVLPMMILVFAMIVEGSRMMWSYQAAISGVRDATRYLARILPQNVCATGGSASGYSTAVSSIVGNSLSGGSVFAGGVTLGTVTPSLSCHSGSYRGGNVAVAVVSAQVVITFPMASVLEFFGAPRPTLTTTITDRSRVFGA